jgi:hypothetical protein
MSETDSTKQMITATDILHGKRDKILFSAIALFFNIAKGTILQHWKRSRRGIFPPWTTSDYPIRNQVPHV